MRWSGFSPVLVLVFLSWGLAAEGVVKVSDDASLRAALRQARPGTHVRIAPGRYAPGVYVSGLQGTERAPIVIEGAEANNPPIFEGGSEGWHLTDCAFVTLRNIAVSRQSSNGINIDDGGSFESPSHHIVLEKLRVTDIGPRGNHDAIKLSGVTDFVVRDCVIEGWGGQAPDMVGCHRGLIEGCTFRGKEGFSQHSGPQTKGGSSRIVIRRCLFQNAAARGVNLGGSTGLAYFRPQGALYEAKDVTVEGCTFVGCKAPIAYVGVDSAVVRYNTFYRPGKWVIRILQETTEKGFVPCRRGRFEHNLVVFRRAEVSVPVNVGPATQPETFQFSHNLWFCEDRPAASRPRLPVPETSGLYGVDPRFADPGRNNFRPQNPEAAGYGARAFRPRGTRLRVGRKALIAP
jgi:hypothetical protein